MAIVNRDLDVSQQDMQVNANVALTVSNASYPVWVAPFPCQLIAAMEAVGGLSGTPHHSLWLNRFIVGAGITAIAIGATLVPTAFGTSGGRTYTIAAAASSYPLQAGDCVYLGSATDANSACNDTAVTLVVRCLQDIKSYFGTV